ncbi:Methylthioribose-1-phosphate isomerase protein [Enhygromyxa salina]|uniref:Methylthioribose-1-phosphate isomerase protein n=1 Tax=Enhygromyxa salina TaxID=215803 RepID=A0A0C2D1P4_9BACT|nr:PaaI family thioesterase [Enhygromyxa salina]KIG14087.1 Methylthioribose-1-phosphate isomerase protein [Enhygromyxa salina]
MTKANTHPEIDQSLCGEILSLAKGAAQVELTTDPRMAADERGLVHGGFIFGAADYAAMLAVNDPNVVLGAASVTFLAPTRVGERVHFNAQLQGEKGRKRSVDVKAHVGATQVFEGSFTCFVLDHHVLDKKG